MSQVYANILNSLTTGLYIQVNIGLREYLQNAYDAVKVAKQNNLPEPRDRFHVEVKITRDGRNITVSDNGIGMDLAVLQEYTSIGGGTKNSPDYAGHKGIGKLAGLRFFDRFVVRTKQIDSNTGYELSWRSGDMMKVLLGSSEKMKKISYGDFIRDYYEIKPFPDEHTLLHYTQVQLIDVLDEFRDQVSEESIGRFIQANCPVPFLEESFQQAGTLSEFLAEHVSPVITYLNDKVIYQPYHDRYNLVKPFCEDLKYSDRLRAKLWFSWESNEAEVIAEDCIRGIKFRCKGICVGDRNLFANNCMPEGRNSVADWFTGEICIIDDGIKPNTARDGFEKSATVKKFYDELKKHLGKKLSYLATVRSEIHAAEQHLLKVERALADGKPLSPAELAKLEERRKVLVKYRDNDKHRLNFSVIAKIERVLRTEEAGAVERVSEVTKQVNAVIANGNTERVITTLLDLKAQEVQTPSKKAKKELGHLIDKAKSVLKDKAETPPVRLGDAQEQTIVAILISYLESKGITYDLKEVQGFVRRKRGQ
jgi:hypothetical protein